MIIHSFAFRWKPEASEAQKVQAAEAIRALQGPIPGLIATYVGTNVSPRSLGYQLGGVMHFEDRIALDAYHEHPLHQALLAWLVPLIEAVEVDFDPEQ